MNRTVRRTARTAIDIALLSAAYWGAFLARFELDLPLQMLKRLVFTWPWVVALQLAAMAVLGVTRFTWRYTGLREALRLGSALVAAAVVLVLVRSAAVVVQPSFPHAQYALVPLGVVLIDLSLAILFLGGARAARRIQNERASRRETGGRSEDAIPTLLVGAGQAGVMVAKELANRNDLGIRAVGFVDDDPAKLGQVIHGLKVLGTTHQVVEIARREGARQVLIAMASAPRKAIRRVAMACEEAGVPAKIIPGIFEIVGGKVNLSRIRKVEIEDLLGREPVALDIDAISRQLAGKVVLVTGAGGSIGSEICRQVANFRPARLVLLEQAENALFHIHRELVAAHPGLDLVPIIADVCDDNRIRTVFESTSPNVVFHAAAHKHVPMMEWNPGEAVKNNVFGTMTVASWAHASGAESFVMISTDKAVNPTSVMGATKRVAELYVQGLAQHSKTRFVTVRFGNVLGSAGSVIPIFQEQIAAGGPVKVTHPEMQRYFMTIPEACQLVMQAGTMGAGGEIFVLDMGEPVKIVDLARDLITLSGLKVGEDIEIVFTGIRPGEKLFEELSVAEEHATKTRHPKIFIGHVREHEWAKVLDGIEALRRVVDGAPPAAVRAALQALVPEYTPVVIEDRRPAARKAG